VLVTLVRGRSPCEYLAETLLTDEEVVGCSKLNGSDRVDEEEEDR
jgi:hypothetical protein